jgi:Ca2+-binding RTX toxin-like protein
MADFPAVIDLDTLDGTDGFRLDGVDIGDYSGFSVASAGDVNGDGFDDVVIGAFLANAGTGATYVVFGQDGGFPPDLDLAALDGSNGFRLDGINDFDLSGYSVASAGDVNGDGYDDVIVGAWHAAPGGNQYAGESYVVFGHAGPFDASVNLGSLDGSDGFRLDGIQEFDYSGFSVASAGDVNGDGFDDVIVGAYYAAGGDPYAGEAYVVFGHGGPFDPSLDLADLDGSDGFRLGGIVADDYAGFSVASAGDVNGDGFADLIVGAPHATGGGYSYEAGETYVVFGTDTGFDAVLDLADLNGHNGFRLEGFDPGDYSGISVALAGDDNGDGYDDLIIGAYLAGGDSFSGASYVVFGRRGHFGADIDLGALDGTDGFRIDGDMSDYSGRSVASAGDVNGDGFDDIIIGAPGCGCYAGSAYVVFGHGGSFAPSVAVTALDGDNGFILDGIEDYDRTANSVASAGDVNGDGFADVIVGAPAADAGGDADGGGESYVVFGQAPTTGVTRTGAAAGQTILGGAFADRLIGLGGSDRLAGGDGSDVLQGGGHDDTLIGGDGRDWLVGGQGADTMRGGDGDDIYQISVAGDLAIENANEGRDLAVARVDYALADNVENLQLVAAARVGTGNGLDNKIFGSGGDDTLAGLAGADVLRGNAGADTLDGGDDADLIDGGLGQDTLTGGTGRDVFQFRDGDTDADRSFADLIADFSHADREKIQLNRLDADTTTGGDQAFAWIGNGAFTAAAGQLHYVHDGGNTYVEGDTDGDGTADFVIMLTGTVNLVASDFVL